MKKLQFLTRACAVLSIAGCTAGFVAFQEQLPVTPIITLSGFKGVVPASIDGYVAPALGTARLYFTDADSTLWLYDRESKRTTLVSRGILGISRCPQRAIASRAFE